MHVLIVDDEADIRTLVSAFLKKEGITSTCCESCADALISMKNKSFDHYLFDVHLPDGSGIELVKQVYGLHKKASVILMSAYDDAMDSINSESIPVPIFLKKPFSNQQLLAMLTNTYS